MDVRSAVGLSETLCDRMDDTLLCGDLATPRINADTHEGRNVPAWKGVSRDAHEAISDKLGFTGLRVRPARVHGESLRLLPEWFLSFPPTVRDNAE